MFRIFTLVLLITEVFLASNTPESDSSLKTTAAQEPDTSPLQYLTPGSEFVVSIGRINECTNVYYHDYIGVMISEQTAISYIHRRYIQATGNDKFYVNTAKEVEEPDCLYHIGKFGNFDSNEENREEFYTYVKVEIPVVFTTLTPEFPVCAYEVGDHLDYAVVKNNPYFFHALNEYIFVNTRVDKLDISECLLKNDTVRFCVNIPTDNDWVTLHERSCPVFSDKKIVGIITSSINGHGVLETLKELKIRCN